MVDVCIAMDENVAKGYQPPVVRNQLSAGNVDLSQLRCCFADDFKLTFNRGLHHRIGKILFSGLAGDETLKLGGRALDIEKVLANLELHVRQRVPDRAVGGLREGSQEKR